MPHISVILPTHNGAKWIRRAIESVRAQTFKDWELVIVNDGSTDQTGALVAEIAAIEPRIRILRFTKNVGIQKALNEGLLQSRGELIARIDDDDVWSDADKLTKQAAFLTQHPEHVLVGTGVIVQDEEGTELYRFRNPISDIDIRRRILYRNCFSHSSVLFRRSAAMEFNGYSEAESALHIEDYDLWLKLGARGQLANLPDFSIRFTSRTGAISGRHKIQQLAAQLRLIQQFKKAYPGYSLAYSKSWLRYHLYRIAGSLIPSGLRVRLLRYYKTS